MKSTPLAITRRRFLRNVGAVGGAALLTRTTLEAVPSVGGPMPMRTLGKTGVQVSALTLGTWPCGKCEELGVEGVERLVRESLELGINHIDTARAYGHGETAIGRALVGHRDKVFLATKTWADTADEARESFETSLRELKTDHVDLVYIHSMGNRDPKKVLGPGGALEYLLKQKQAGKTRFVGITGHSQVPHFLPLIESDQLDVVLMTMNFVDRHTYGFETKVLPAANKRKLGVCCMKVFGGMKGGFTTASGPNTGPEVPVDYLQRAVRYALHLPGVSTLVIGPHTVKDLRQNAAWVKAYEPLPADELAHLDKLGRQLAKAWGPHFGPVS